MLPFTHAQFIEDFARYNASVWPAQAYLLALAMVAAMLSPSQGKGRFVAGGLALIGGLSVILLLRPGDSMTAASFKE